HVDIENRIVEVFRDLAERRVLRDAGIREHDVESPLLSSNLFEETIEIAKVRHVAAHARDLPSDRFDRGGQFGFTTSGDEHERALADERLCGRKADAAGAAGHERDSSLKLAHVVLLWPSTRF